MPRQVKIEIRDTENNIVGTLDLKDNTDFPLAMTFSSVNIQTVNNRQSNYTKKFSIPETKNNAELLGYIYSANLIDDKERKTFKDAVILVDGLVFDKGQIKVTNIIQTSSGTDYEMSYIGGNNTWVQKAKALELKDIDLGTITWDATVVTDSWTDEGSNHIFPLIARGEINTTLDSVGNTTIFADKFYPAMRVRDVLVAGFTNIGYTIESDFIDGLSGFNFNKLMMPFTDKYLRQKLSEDDMFVDFNANSPDVDSFTGSGTTNTPIFSADFGGYVFDQSNNYDTSTGEYTVPIEGAYKFNTEDLEYETSGATTVTVEILVNGTAINIAGNSNILHAGVETVTVETTYDFIWLEVSDVVRVNVRTSDADTATVGTAGEFKCEFSDRILFGETFELGHSLPDDSFFNMAVKGAGGLFNLQFRADEVAKKVFIEPRNDFYVKANTIDWSQKLDIQRDFQLSIITSYKDELNFSYINDSSDGLTTAIDLDASVDVGSFIRQLSDRFSDGQSDIGSSYFAPTTDFEGVGIFRRTPAPAKPATLPTVFIPTFWTEDVRDTVKADGVDVAPDVELPDFSTDFEPRILYHEGFRNAGDYWFGAGVNAQFLFHMPVVQKASKNELFMIDYEGTTDVNLSFRDFNSSQNRGFRTRPGLYETYWRETADLIEEGLLLVAYFNLNTTDINQLDFRKPIFIDHPDLKGYWTINRIIDNKPHRVESTKVELIKLRATNVE